MNAVGTNTAHNTSAVAMIGLVTSRIARSAAAIGESPNAMLRSTFSTTTIASSTTIPIASTSPNSERLLMEKPSASITAKVPTNDTGTAASGMMDARHVCKNRMTTITTSSTASTSVWITASIECRTNVVGSYTTA